MHSLATGASQTHCIHVTQTWRFCGECVVMYRLDANLQSHPNLTPLTLRRRWVAFPPSDPISHPNLLSHLSSYLQSYFLSSPDHAFCCRKRYLKSGKYHTCPPPLFRFSREILRQAFLPCSCCQGALFNILSRLSVSG